MGQQQGSKRVLLTEHHICTHALFFFDVSNQSVSVSDTTPRVICLYVHPKVTIVSLFEKKSILRYSSRLFAEAPQIFLVNDSVKQKKAYSCTIP